MIDPQTEQLFPFSEVRHYIPSSRWGKRLHLATIHRWRRRGIAGVVLEAVRVDGTWMTSREAISRFSTKLTSGKAPQEPTTPNLLAREAEAVERELDSMGF